MSIKNPLTPAGIEPATLQFAAQHLNHCATAVPTYIVYNVTRTQLLLSINETTYLHTDNYLVIIITIFLFHYI